LISAGTVTCPLRVTTPEPFAAGFGGRTAISRHYTILWSTTRQGPEPCSRRKSCPSPGARPVLEARLRSVCTRAPCWRRAYGAFLRGCPHRPAGDLEVRRRRRRVLDAGEEGVRREVRQLFDGPVTVRPMPGQVAS